MTNYEHDNAPDDDRYWARERNDIRRINLASISQYASFDAGRRGERVVG